MGSEAVVIISLFCLVFLCFIGILAFFGWIAKRCSRKLLQGNLREDYVRNNPNLLRNGKVICHCGNTRILLRNIERNGSDVIREHVCDQCGTRLYYSASGEYYADMVRELRKEACLVAVPMPAPSE